MAEEIVRMDEFPPGCTCERIDIGGPADLVGAKVIRGHSDPPCKVHLPAERTLYDAAYRRGFDAGLNAGYDEACKDYEAPWRNDG